MQVSHTSDETNMAKAIISIPASMWRMLLTLNPSISRLERLKATIAGCRELLFDGSADEWGYSEYCPISINSAAPVTRDTPAEILVSADARNGRDIIFFPAGWAGQIFIFIIFIYHILK